jgi:hypothetical protein
MDIKELLDYYYQKFIPAYADAVASLGDKPVQLLVEQENTLAHLLAYLEDESDKANLKKACGHLERATLDCYKIIWIEYKEKLKFFISLDNSNLALAFNSNESEVLEKIKKIDSLAKEARELESINIGKNSTLALDKYIEVVELEKELLDSVDLKKASSYNKFKLSHLIKDHSLGFILGIIAGLATSYLWERFF